MKEPVFRKGEVVRYPNKGYDYRITEFLGWSIEESDYVYTIVFDQPYSEAGKRFKTNAVEKSLVKKLKE
jgi:hypothetical protein